MKPAEQIIIEYELARQSIIKLNNERVLLLSSCKNKYDDPFTSCFTNSWAEYNAINESSDIYGGYHHFHEVISSMDESECCENCLASYEMKIGPIAEAKKAYGHAKRAISVRGKKLITEGLI